MQRRKLLQTAGLAFSATLGAPGPEAVAQAPQQTQNPEKIRGYPVLMNPTRDSLSVVWVASGPCCGSVEYGPSPDQLIHKALSRDHYGYASLEEVHKVRLKDLPMGEPVYYRVLTHKVERPFTPQDTSAVYSFTLPGAEVEEVRFAHISDTHEHAKTVDRLFARLAELKPDFFIWNGDIVDWVTSKERIIKAVLLAVDRPYAATIPMIFSRGNHDAFPSVGYEYSNCIGSPEDRFYYMFRLGPVAFAILDSERGDHDAKLPPRDSFEAYRKEHAEWAKKEFKRSDIASAPVRIAVFHLPLWSRRQDFPFQPMRDFNLRTLEENKVNLCMCGHMHTYEYLKPGDDARAPEDPNPPPVSLHQIIGGGPREAEALIIMATATKDKITLVTENLNRKIIDTVVIPC